MYAHRISHLSLGAWLALLILLTPQKHLYGAPTSCRAQVRGLFDVGSGTLKLNLYEVEICGAKIQVLRTIADSHSEAVPLEASKQSGVITQVDTLLKALKNLKAQARRDAPNAKIAWAAVGTHALRTAKNKNTIVNRFKLEKVPLKILSHKEEAEIGLRALRNNQQSLPQECAQKPLTLWDIGGGSQQWVITRHNKDSFEGMSLGAEAFKMDVIARQIHNTALTPNPLGLEGRKAAVQLAEQLAATTSLAYHPPQDGCVVGIGSVHNKSIWDAFHRYAQKCKPSTPSYELSHLNCLLDELQFKTDDSTEIRGPYATMAATNVALVLGFMTTLKIERVYPIPLNLTHGLMTDNQLVNFQRAP